MYNKSSILIQLEAKLMKQFLAILATIIVYTSSVLLIDSVLAADHHNNASQQELYQHDNHDHDGDRHKHHGKGRGDSRGDRDGLRMLFRGLELDEEQRAQVGSIMREQMEKGRQQGEALKASMFNETRDQLSGVLSEEQLEQFNRNAERAKEMGDKMKAHAGKHPKAWDKKGKRGKKGKKGKKKPKHNHQQ
jgi:hypothetical protein